MRKLLFLFLFLPLFANATLYYVSSTGNDGTGNGTIGNPWKSLTRASAFLAAKATKGAGDSVLIRGGTYNGFPNNPANGYAQLLINGLQGTATNPCVFTNYPGESPLFDFFSVVVQAARPSPTALSIFSSSYLKIKGLRFYGYHQILDGSGVSRGVELNGCSNITIEQCEVFSFQGTGFFISGGTQDVLYLNCDSHNNEDPLSATTGGAPGSDAWDNADGFGVTGTGNTSTRITFDGCRAWLNCDDGWDNFGTDGSRLWKNCWAYANGYYQRPGMPVPLPAGNGQGFKLGPTGQPLLNTSGLRNLQNCLAFNNRSSGYDQNGEITTIMTLLNCTAYANQVYGFQFQFYPVSPQTIAHVIKNCSALSNAGGNVNLASAIPSGVTNNSWQPPVTISAADFLSTDTTGVSGARQADGSLPNLNFMKLASSSDLINAGTNVGLPFCQTAPDINWFEYCPSSSPPVANAGVNQTIQLPLSQVTLSGSATTSGSISSWFWRALTFPSNPTISNPVAQTTTATGLIAGVYTFELRVVDNSGLSDTDTMQVTVNAPTPTAPTCSAGTTPVTIQLPTSTVALNGSGASTSGNTVSYLWTLQSGSGGTITSPTSAVTTATGLTAGSRTYRLTVTDNGNSLTCISDKVVITNAAATPPTANAGNNQTITLPTNSTSLTGSGTGGSGTITGYGWVKIQGGAATITTPTSQSPSITNMVQGIYLFELTVTASTGLTAKDTVQVVVLPAANIPPVANAGSDQTITLPVTNSTLSGSGTDTDGTITGYNWTQVSGTAAVISNPTAPTTTITGLTTSGVRVFRLTVTDNNGATGTDDVQVTVNPVVQTVPTCNAGTTPVTITLPVNTIALSGSGASTSGNTVSFLWGFTLGTGTIANNTAQVTTATISTAGNYAVSLLVTDNFSGLTCTSSKSITVNPALIIPTANAGSDQTITLPTSSVSLSGSGSGGTINSYLWTKISGVGGSFSAATSANTNFSGLIAGTYVVQLRVGNTDGNFNTDQLTITVNPAIIPAPTVQARTDTSITLPLNSCALTATATGTGLTYKWNKLSASAGNIVNSTSLNATAQNLVEATYLFEIVVTDVNTNVVRDTFQLIVNPIPVYEFTVDAGANQQLFSPVTSTTLTGTVFSSYGVVTSYQWLPVSGSASTIVSPSNISTAITGLTLGVYRYSLTAVTEFGWVLSDTVTVTVSDLVPATGYQYYQLVINSGKAEMKWGYIGAKTGSNFQVQKKFLWWFNKVSDVAAKTGTSNYTFVDNKTSNGTSTYRIRYGNDYTAEMRVKKN